MVGMRGAAHVSALKCELAAEACDKFRAQAAKTPFFDQKSKTALGARLPWAMIAVNFDEFHHHRGGLEDLHKYIQGRSDGESSRPILPPTSTLKPSRPAFFAGPSAVSCDSPCVQLSLQ